MLSVVEQTLVLHPGSDPSLHNTSSRLHHTGDKLSRPPLVIPPSATDGAFIETFRVRTPRQGVRRLSSEERPAWTGQSACRQCLSSFPRLDHVNVLSPLDLCYANVTHANLCQPRTLEITAHKCLTGQRQRRRSHRTANNALVIQTTSRGVVHSQSDIQ